MKNVEENASYIQAGQDRITQILREFEMGCDEAIIRREGKRLILEPKKRTLSASETAGPLKNDSLGSEIKLFGDFRF